MSGRGTCSRIVYRAHLLISTKLRQMYALHIQTLIQTQLSLKIILTPSL